MRLHKGGIPEPVGPSRGGYWDGVEADGRNPVRQKYNVSVVAFVGRVLAPSTSTGKVLLRGHPRAHLEENQHMFAASPGRQS